MDTKPTPRVLYQTWKTRTVPEKFKKNQRMWFDSLSIDISGVSRNHASLPEAGEWRYVLLDDNDLRELVKTNFPQFLKAYDSFSKQIERVDFARCVMMYLGGVYADLDTYPTQNIDPWVALNRIVLGCEPMEHAERYYDGRRVVLCNAFMISPPGESLWVKLMEYIIEHYESNYKPVYNTGPMAMTKFMEATRSTSDVGLGDEDEIGWDRVVITDPCVFFPMLGDGKISRRCRPPPGETSRTYVVHEWENTWVVPWWRDRELLNPRHWVWWGLVATMMVGAVVYYRRSRTSSRS